jgi:hypothetical protein
MTTTRTETVANGVVFEQAMPSLLEAQGGSERLGGLERRRESLDERHCVGIVAAARGPDQANRLGRGARATGRRRGTSGQTRGGKVVGRRRGKRNHSSPRRQASLRTKTPTAWFQRTKATPLSTQPERQIVGPVTRIHQIRIISYWILLIYRANPGSKLD